MTGRVRLLVALGAFLALGAGGFVSACSSTDNGPGGGAEGGADVAADTGAADSTAPDVALSDAGPDTGNGDAEVDTGGGNVPDTGPGDPALAPDAATVACPMTINDSIDPTDGTQAGRVPRSGPASTCGTPKAFPGTSPDPMLNPHLFRAYRFANPTGAQVCFNFTLTYGPTAVGDAGSDADAVAASPDASGDGASQDAAEEPGSGDASADAVGDAGASDASMDAATGGATPARYLAAYSTFYPADISVGYLADVGGELLPPQSMGVTVPAGGTIDVVVYAIEVAPNGVGPFTLSCATQ